MFGIFYYFWAKTHFKPIKIVKQLSYLLESEHLYLKHSLIIFDGFPRFNEN